MATFGCELDFSRFKTRSRFLPVSPSPVEGAVVFVEAAAGAHGPSCSGAEGGWVAVEVTGGLVPPFGAEWL